MIDHSRNTFNDIVSSPLDNLSKKKIATSATSNPSTAIWNKSRLKTTYFSAQEHKLKGVWVKELGPGSVCSKVVRLFLNNCLRFFW
jgi:hypothetical protein